MWMDGWGHKISRIINPLFFQVTGKIFLLNFLLCIVYFIEYNWLYCSHEIKRHFLIGRKVLTNLDSMLKSRDITLLTKIHIVKAMVFPVVMYRCESWTVKKAESGTIDAFELCLEKTARRSNQSLLKKNNPEYSLEGLMLKLVLATWCEELSRKRPWCWVRLMQGGE